MKIQIKYFGQIAEFTGKSEEEMRFNTRIDLARLDHEISSKYQIGKQNYRLSLNQRLINDVETLLNDNDEIAYLPPFAGG